MMYTKWLRWGGVSPWHDIAAEARGLLWVGPIWWEVEE